MTEKLLTALKFGLLWLGLGILQATYELLMLYSYKIDPGGANFWVLLKSYIVTSFVAGVLAGFFILPRVNSWLRTHAYGKALLWVLLSISVLYALMSTLGSFVFNLLKHGGRINDPIILSEVATYMQGSENLKNYLFWLLVGVITIVAIQVNDKYGPGTFINFLLGRYFHPKEEQRIFMFLDIRSSTTIAEKLTALKYFAFIKEFFQDVTPALLRAKGEIYQYVGDEIVVSWTLENGFKNNNCIAAFFDAQTCLTQRQSEYQEKYGITPEFKVGIHCGPVISGEVGIIKRDIAFSGDVLNTTARIQAQCNQLGVNILVSDAISTQLRLTGTAYQLQSVGQVDLRGKAQALELFTVYHSPAE